MYMLLDICMIILFFVAYLTNAKKRKIMFIQ